MSLQKCRSADLNYFICTLGQAAHVSKGSHYSDVNHLIDQQATHNGELPAIGFYKTQRETGGSFLLPHVLNFRQVRQGVHKTAELLSECVGTVEEKTIALLSASSSEFFFSWLACIRLGLSVLLIAPECPPSGVASLCRSCAVKVLLVDDKNRKLGEKASTEDSEYRLKVHSVPFNGGNVFDLVSIHPTLDIGKPQVTDTDIAYFHHTSGTSSGTPKPIPQTHHGAVGVLPRLNGQQHATFTTTPLYHGGPADIFRAWTSNAMIWLFPSKDLPITAANIVKCLDAASPRTSDLQTPPISYFATVPHILQSLSSDQEAMERLRRMDLVSVGGAALPQETGDALVQAGINLVSRFGSAECGFLLSSHRPYESDNEWQFLRLDPQSSQITFEPRDGGLSELVVLPDWPHMAKRNRPNGSYATADLFEPHPELEHAWKYHSRADAQLTLVTGKKFDPSPIEDGIVAALQSVIADAFVFGDGRPYPGVLVFRSKDFQDKSVNDVLDQVLPVVEDIGRRGSKHATISRSMVIPMPYSPQPLDKSSKGTILRRQAQEHYAEVIDTAYNGIDGETVQQCPDEKLPEVIAEIVRTAHPDNPELTYTSDLFALGIDSMAGIRIRNQLQRLLPAEAPRLPTNVVEDCGTVESLAHTIASLRAGKDTKSGEKDVDLMWELANKYKLKTTPMPHGNAIKETVLLTGCTGSLGSHILHLLTSHRRIKHIYALVRADTSPDAEMRVKQSLSSRNLGLPSADKVTVLKADLGDVHLGLDPALYSTLQEKVTVTIHLAWNVNFRLHVRHFEKDSILSLFHLLQFSANARFAFCSSVASISSSPVNPGLEEFSSNPSDAGTIGYSQAKWIGEKICQAVPGCSVWRVGQLAGDARGGVWNRNEAWPMLLSSVKVTGCLPDLEGEVLDWLPVDVAAQGMVQGIIDGRAEGVLHVVNGHSAPVWRDMLAWLKKRVEFEIVAPLEWIQKMDGVEKRGVKHPAFQLLEHWRSAFSGEESKERKSFATERTEAAVLLLRKVQEVNEEYFWKLWDWIDANVR